MSKNTSTPNENNTNNNSVDKEIIKSTAAGSNPESSSNASNYNSLGYQIDPRTGSLQVSITPPALSGFFGSAITPSIRYAQQSMGSGLQMLGLPLGWSYQLSFIYGGRVFINGQSSYYIDSEYDSGMRYYTLSNAVFDASALTLSFYSGETQYFDQNGRLTRMTDRFENSVSFGYDTDDDVYSSKLVKIIDSYGQQTTLSYSASGITITYPPNGKNPITFQYLVDADSYLIGYINPLGEQTNFINNGGIANNLVSQISYPNELVVKYEYGTLLYFDQPLNPLPTSKQLDCVSSVQEASSGGQTRTINYEYNIEGDYHNFTGYPNYTTYDTIPGTDNLLATPTVSTYQYSTSVNDGLSITQHIYNHLHLELETKVYTAVSSTLTTHTTNTYAGQDSDGLFPIYTDLIINYPNYQTPIEVVTRTYNDGNTNQFLARKVATTFDDYGNPTQVSTYQSQVCTSGDPTTWTLMSQENTTYSTSYGQILQKDLYDYTSNPSNPEIRRTVNTLTADSKNIATSTNGLVVSSVFQKSKQASYQYDSEGRVILEEFAWADGQPHTLPSTQATTTYSPPTPATPVLTVTNIDAHDLPTTSQIDTTTGWLTNQKDALGDEVSYTYDSLGRKLTQTDPMGVVTIWVYDDINNKVTTKYANGYQTYLYTDGFGQTIKTSDNMGPSGSERVLSTKTYNNLGQLTQEEGILGKYSLVTYTYDDRGNLSTATDILDNVTSYTYDAVAQTKTTLFNGNRVSEVTTNNTVTTAQTYSATDPSQFITTTATSNAYQKTVSSILGNKSAQSWFETNYVYNADLNLENSSSTAADGIIGARSYKRDLFANSVLDTITVTLPGQALKQNPSQTTSGSFTYNILNQLTAEINALNQSTLCTYDSAGRQLTYTDYAGTGFTSKYNANSQVTAVSWMYGGGMYEKQFAYDPTTHQLQSITDVLNEANQGSIQYTYTLDSNLSSMTYPDGKKIAFTYNNQKGELSQFTDALGNVTEYGYDDYGRLINAQVVGTAYSVAFVYYTKAQDPNNSGKLLSETTNNNVQKSYTYDGFGSVATVTVTDTTKTENNVLLNMVYSYDPTTRNVIKIAYTSTASPTNANLNYTVEYTYNSLNQLITETTLNPGGSTLSTITYAYDAANNVTSETTEVGGQTTSIAYTYDADNKLMAITVGEKIQVLQYDANGNLIDDGAGSTFTYDAKNNLIDYQNKNTNVQATYTYYPDGTRATKQTTSTDAIQFYYDGSGLPNIVNEVQAGTNTNTSYLMLGGTRYVRLVHSQSQTTPQYFIDNQKDTLGTINSSNTFGDTYVYDPYGEETDSSPKTVPLSLNDNPFRYTGEYTDLESSLIYLRARYYNPTIKRFMSRDTTTLVNRYVYADGNPIMNIDPSGYSPSGWAIFGGIVAIVGAVALTIVTAGTASPIAAGMAIGALAGFGLSSTIYGATHADNFNAADYGIMVGAGALFGAAGGAFAGAGIGAGAARFAVAKALTLDVAFNTGLGGIDGYVTNGFINLNHGENFNIGWGPALGFGLAGGFGSSLLLGGFGRGLVRGNGRVRARPEEESTPVGISLIKTGDCFGHSAIRINRARGFDQSMRNAIVGDNKVITEGYMREWGPNEFPSANGARLLRFDTKRAREIEINVKDVNVEGGVGVLERKIARAATGPAKEYNRTTNSCVSNVVDGLRGMGFRVPIYARTPWTLHFWFKRLGAVPSPATVFPVAPLI